MVRVMIFEQRELVREGFAAVLGKSPALVVQVGAVCLPGLLEGLERDRPEVLLFSLDVKGVDPFVALNRVRRAQPGLAVLLFGVPLEASTLCRGLALGAAGFVSHESTREELEGAILRARARGVPLGATLSGKPAVRGLRRLPHERLSNREQEVFQGLIEGKTNKEISRLLSISPKTTSTHRRHVLDKLAVPSTAAAVAYWWRWQAGIEDGPLRGIVCGI